MIDDGFQFKIPAGLMEASERLLAAKGFQDFLSVIGDVISDAEKSPVYSPHLDALWRILEAMTAKVAKVQRELTAARAVTRRNRGSNPP